DVAEVGADGARDAAGACLRRQHGQHALHEHRERHQGEAGADRHRGDRPHAGRPSEVRMSARTTNDMPTSMLSPVNVRSHQYGLMATTVSRNSAPAISMNPCCSPCALSTRAMEPMPSAISQNPQLASRKDASGAPARRGQTESTPATDHTMNV